MVKKKIHPAAVYGMRWYPLHKQIHVIFVNGFHPISQTACPFLPLRADLVDRHSRQSNNPLYRAEHAFFDRPSLATSSGDVCVNHIKQFAFRPKRRLHERIENIGSILEEQESQ